MFEATYESKYGYKFKSFDLNKMKYMELLHTGYELRDFRNELSRYVWDNFDKYLIKMSSTEFLKEIRNNYEPASKLDSNFDYD